MNDTCPARKPDGWQCTRNAGHTGRHAAQRDNSRLTWDDHGNSTIIMTSDQ